MPKDQTFCFRLESTTKARLKDAAQERGLSVSELLHDLIDQCVSHALAKPGQEPTRVAPAREQQRNEDRRSGSRLRISIPAMTTHVSREAAESLPCRISDISMGGALLRYQLGANAAMPKMDWMQTFTLTMLHPMTEAPINLTCRARHLTINQGACYLGTTFVPADSGDTKVLRDLLGPSLAIAGGNGDEGAREGIA